MIVILFMSNEQTSIEKQGHSYKFIIFVLEQKNRNVLVVFTSKIGLDFRVLVGSDVTYGLKALLLIYP